MPKNLVEAVVGRQVLVQISEVVLAELAGGVPHRLQHLGDGGILRPQAEIGSGKTDLQQPSAETALTGDERGPPGSTAILAVGVGENHPLVRDAVDIGRLVAHDAHVVGADVVLADVIAPDNQDIGLVLSHCGGRREGHGKYEHQQRYASANQYRVYADSCG